MGAWIEILLNTHIEPPIIRRSSRGSVDWNISTCSKIACKCVAPLVGAWIEIPFMLAKPPPQPSLLSWERGLKLYMEYRWEYGEWSLLSWERGLKCIPCRQTLNAWYVAPLVGAWIEILSMRIDTNQETVAPLVGAWIEIVKYMLKAVVKESLLSWERGLKFSYSASDWSHSRSLSSWERGLKSQEK